MDGEHSAYINGDRAKGGSTFKKHFTKPFNKGIAYGLSKSWNVPADAILKIWSDKGKSTASFGKGIHLMRELKTLGQPLDEAYQLVIDSIKDTRKLYVSNRENGEIIYKNSKSANDNYAKPTHTDIVNLMTASDEKIKQYMYNVETEFETLYKKLGFDIYEAVPEAYVTYSPLQMGGEVDNLLILDMENKICRVQDYKIQGDIDDISSKNELINELKKKKASKLDVIKIQLSYYAFCLHKAGWTVEGGDVFARDGKWRHYKIDLIPMDKMEELLVKYL